MPPKRTLAGALGEGLRNFQSGRQFNLGMQGEQMNQALTMAKLQSMTQPLPAGYVRVGDQVLKDPNNLDPKEQLEAEKLRQEVKNMKDYNEQRTLVPQDSGQPFVMDPMGKFHPNPNMPKPLNDLQKARLESENRKLQAADDAQKMEEDNLRSTEEENLKSIEEIKKTPEFFGPLGNLPSVPVLTGDYAKRKNWEANVNKLLSQKVLDTMTAMKKASKTGATGFGQLSNKELEVLQNASTALKRDLAPQEAMKYLNEMEAIHKKVLGKNTGTAPTGNQPMDGSQVSGVGETGTIPIKYASQYQKAKNKHPEMTDADFLGYLADTGRS